MRKWVLAGAIAIGVTANSSSNNLLGQEQEQQQANEVEVAAAEGTGLWFVELASRPTADGSSVATLEREEANFHAAAAAARAEYVEKQHFRSLFNGLTVRADARSIAKIGALAGVRAVYPVVRVDLAQDQDVSVPELATAIRQTGADIAQSDFGLSGTGITVAVMDTGIDYNHPDLGGCFGPGCRVEKGHDFVGNAFNADPASPTYNPIAVPDNDPDDCNGHGTHVSGIVGANGGVRGVAPGVKFHAYRVFGCEGSTTSDIMLAAMEMVYNDGADILNMSIGSSFQWPQYPTAAGADLLARRGVVVVASIGNSGANGLYSSSAPGVGADVIGVASFDNTHDALRFFTVSPDNRSVGFNSATGAPAAPTSGSVPMARTGTPASTADACNGITAPAPGSLTGQIALIRRGTCGFYEKALNAQNAGAAGVVLYNNVAGRVNPTVAGTPPITIPVVAITSADGVTINDRIAAGPTTLTWTNQVGSFLSTTGNLISSFSSYGLAPDLSLKPDIGAPGGSIRSTIPLEQGGYGSISGTSMASPHVAGAVALLLEARPTIKALDVRHWLQNSADPHLWFGNPSLGFLDNVHRQGAGMLRIDEAVLADVVATPGKIALGEVDNGATVEALIRVRLNKSPLRSTPYPSRVKYTLGHVPALATGANTFAPAFNTGFATVTFPVPDFVLGGPDTGWNFKALITAPPTGTLARLFGGYITMTPDDGGPVISVPYSGYVGDYQAIQVLVPTANNFPWLARLSGTTFTNQPSGATFTMQGQDTPHILAHLDHASRELRFEIIDVATGRSAGTGFLDDYLPRNSTATTFFDLPWDGTAFLDKGQTPRVLPNGTYQIRLVIFKALGRRENPAHFETWTSPNITIARPPS